LTFGEVDAGEVGVGIGECHGDEVSAGGADDLEDV
jgi:hypothetical protein